MAYATGKRSKAISDRSGMEFPYKEMVKEWNGSIVHVSEYEAKHPQLDPPYHKADAIALLKPRPDVNPGSGALVDLSPAAWPGQFQSNGMQPNPVTPNDVNNSRQALSSVGSVTVEIS
jgi:hypothetical protein